LVDAPVVVRGVVYWVCKLHEGSVSLLVLNLVIADQDSVSESSLSHVVFHQYWVDEYWHSSDLDHAAV